MFIYQADTYCDSCGERIRAELTAEGYAPEDPDDEWSYDSDNYPKPASEEETDGPDHCAGRGECLEGIDLGEYGLGTDDELIGAETRTIGALLSDGLTPEGVSYLRDMLSDRSLPLTPYQRALHRYWEEVFAEYL